MVELSRKPATESNPGEVEIATQAEVNAGSDNSKMVTPAGIINSNTVLSERPNLIINGAMEVFQRSTGATQTAAARQYLAADRWAVNRQTGAAVPGSINVTQQFDVPAPVDGDFHGQASVRLRCDSVRTTVDPQFHSFEQPIEGLGFRQIRHKKGLFSFYAKSNKLGKYYIKFVNNAGTRTWTENVEITESLVWRRYDYLIDFAAMDETGNSYDAALGLSVRMMFFTSPDKHVALTEGQWNVGGQVDTPADQVDFLDNTANDFFLTNVMLIPLDDGADITKLSNIPFRRAGRSFNEELAVCQRYFQVHNRGLIGGINNANAVSVGCVFPVEMRATPTLSLTAAFSFHVPAIFLGTNSGTTILASYLLPSGFHAEFNNFAAGPGGGYAGHWFGGGSFLLDAEL